MTTGNRRISSLAVPIVASLDPSSKDAVKQWVNLMGRSTEEIQAILGAYSTKTAKSLREPLDNFAIHVDKIIDKAAASAARTGIVPDAALQNLRHAVELSNLLGDSFLKWKASETLNIAESLRLGEALTLAKQLNSELAHVREAAAAGLAGQARMQTQEQGYESAVFDWADRQEAQRRAGHAGKRLDEQTNSPIGLSPAAQAMMLEERRQRASEAGRRLDEHQNPQHSPVMMSPAALAAYADEARQNGSVARQRLDQYGQPTPVVPLSPAVQQYRQQDAERMGHNAQTDTINESPGEVRRSRLFELSRQQETDAEHLRVQREIRHAQALRVSNRQDRMIPQRIADIDGDRSGLPLMEDDEDIDEEATGGRVLQHRSIDGRRRKGVRGRGFFGGLTKSGSHSARFAAQNVGFGIDDAIQSYQYGGAGASIRAASNNATAIAGMLISNPVVAAGAVIAISIASAALPIILRRFGLDKPFSDMTASDRFYNQTKENYLGGYSTNESYKRDKDTSELTWIASQKARLMGRDAESDAQWLQGSLHQGGFTGFINNMAGKQVTGGQKLSQNAAERKLLEAENMDLQMRSNSTWDPTATKELERNLSRMEELEKEDRVLNAERRTDASTISRARQMLPSNLKKIAAMSAFDRDTEMATNRGDLSISAQDFRMERRAEMERKAIRANSSFNSEQQRAELLRVDMKLMEDKSDPNRQRNTALAQLDANVGRLRFNSGISPQNNFTQAQQQVTLQLAALYRQRLDGSLSAGESMNRQAAVRRRGDLLQTRAFQDDIDDLNPERNPLKRLQRSAKRTTEDIMGMDIDPVRKRELLLANLKGRERDAADVMIPGGTRKYITQGYKVGSLEDEELRSRMVGNFGPPVKKEDHDSKTLDQILTALNTLNDKLTIEAAKLGV